MAPTLPRNVQRQLDEAEAQLKSQAPIESTAITDPAQLVVTPPAPAPAPVAEPAPPPPAPAPTENWEQKFRTLQGRFNAEIPELRARETALNSRVAALTEQISALAKAPTKPEPVVDPRDSQQFGEDMVEMVQRNARQVYDALRAEFSQLAEQLGARVAELETKVGGVTKQTEQTLEDSFYSTLGDQVPDWKQINELQGWLDWLAEIDPVYGLPRQAALDSAYQRLDARRVVAIFKQFKDAQKRTAPPSLESQLTPASGGSAPAPTPAAGPKPVLSQKFLQTFYGDVAKGRYASRPQEQQRIEAEINLAAQEGRIV